jgi:alkanesulfonate monooxygenase SsuD/methylene tetrahydromethanopterin reductase-like flavin-dependent oxidoreductase (luciferase family)
MFRAWAFTEMPYPFTPPDETIESVRVTLPSRHYDPEVGFQLYQKYFDIYRRADELGLDIMCNEHHATATCVQPAVPLSMAILARETRHARLLALGNPIANRADPVRVAEEMAMVDVISQGRLECGFVRGVPMEVSAGNRSPVDMKQRFWEAADLIVKAWTTHDGPFSWEGEHFHHRQVNVWPRTYQSPHPPVWVPTQSTSTAREVAERGYTLATILNGSEGCRQIFDTYRRRAAECGQPNPPLDRFAYLGLVFVAATHEAAMDGARRLQWYLQHNKVAPQFMDVPGYVDVHGRGAMLEQKARGEALATPVAHLAGAPIEDLTKDGYFFAGTPDEVLEQLHGFYERVGGFAHLLLMVQGGTMGYDLSVGSMELLASEVLPRFRREVYEPSVQRAGLPGADGDGAPAESAASLDSLRLP